MALIPKGVLLLPLLSLIVFVLPLMRFFFGGLGFAPKEAKLIVEAMSMSMSWSSMADAEGERGGECGVEVHQFPLKGLSLESASSVHGF